VANREHYTEFFDANGALLGPDLTPAELALV
jgi:hypothetical protein